MSSDKPRQEPGILAWHWLRDDCRLGYDDGRLVEVGQELEMLPRRVNDPVCPEVIDTPWLCQAGMHASISPLDALQYTRGNVACRVIIRGDVQHGDDKIVGRYRKVIAMANVEDLLRRFARRCALDVAHLWDMPDIVRRYLETGDESIRAAAWDAAWVAARDAAWAAARDAARDAAWAAARDAAWAAARDAARAAAWAAARDAQSKRLHDMLCAELGCV